MRTQVDGLWAADTVAADFASVVHRQLLLGVNDSCRPTTGSPRLMSCLVGLFLTQPLHGPEPRVPPAQVSMRCGCLSASRICTAWHRATFVGRSSGRPTVRWRQVYCLQVRLQLEQNVAVQVRGVQALQAAGRPEALSEVVALRKQLRPLCRDSPLRWLWRRNTDPLPVCICPSSEPAT